MGASTECLQHLLCLHYSELVTKIFKETDFKCKLKGKCLQAAGTKKKKKFYLLPAASPTAQLESIWNTEKRGQDPSVCRAGG